MNEHVPAMPPHPDLADVRIERIETIPLRVKLDRPAAGSTLRLTHRATIVTRVHTDTGLVGECFNGNDDELQDQIIRMIHDEMAPRLAGRPVAGVSEAWELMRDLDRAVPARPPRGAARHGVDRQRPA